MEQGDNGDIGPPGLMGKYFIKTLKASDNLLNSLKLP